MASQREDDGAMIDDLRADLLRRHVADRADDHAGAREVVLRGLVVLVAGVEFDEEFCETEVDACMTSDE